MQAVFTSKDKGFSGLYGWKFKQSFIPTCEMVYMYNVTCPINPAANWVTCGGTCFVELQTNKFQ